MACKTHHYRAREGAASQDAAALPEIIRQLKADGYTFGTIAELLR